ncbi:outer membrane beta-barrel protein [Aerobium aerolatum]|uniref:Beta-barrel porin 2 n=1 Tax=Aquamicrobium aerolatum DSM 21857 TaxID=1121003 RepID=A0A1I3MU04_9HYPH|nr:outer membrane beta-barrel protein [Aquamicrobium aerolatum]SFJ00503.1 hypothetical protein SAMN03080618_01887 [Aquamicrobium aerolatum DSM 21857]
MSSPRSHVKALSRHASILACATAMLVGSMAYGYAQQVSGLRIASAERSDDDLSTQAASGALAQQRRAVSDEVAETGSFNTRAQTFEQQSGEANERASRDNTRTSAIEAHSRNAEDNPYAPLGLRLGTFLLTPTLEQGLTWTSNASGSAGGREAVLSETTLRLNAVSDWSRHGASVQADGSYRKSLSGESISDVNGGVSGDLRFDLANGYTARIGASYRASPESASSPVDLGNVTSRPLRQTWNANAGLSRDLGKLAFGLNGAISRDLYGSADLAGGSVLSQSHRNSTLASATLRAGYEISPALAPFVEAEIGRRYYDQKVDPNGFERSANRYGLRAGLELDLGEKLRGEVAAGWLTERPDDQRLSAISGPSMNARLSWSPMRGTTVDLNASTSVETTTSVGQSGSLLYSGSLGVSREIRANLTGRALVGLDLRDYSGGGRDLVMRGETSLTWWMNRHAGITGRARHEIQRSTLAGRDYDATSIYLGMTLQR